jgi:hypothetical protein
MSGAFQNIDPSPPGECAPAFGAGEETLAGWRGGWEGQYFGRRQTQLCTLHM